MEAQPKVKKRKDIGGTAHLQGAFLLRIACQV